MAAPSNVTVPAHKIGQDKSVDLLYQIVTSLNYCVGAVRAIATKLDADGGVTDTNYFSTTVDAAGSNPAKQITLTEGL